jgi:leader peptidase (prepilin peptidase)/N-methyltransferase
VSVPPPVAIALAWAPWGAKAPLGMFTMPAYGVLFALGLCLGSFLNVVVYRLPREHSIVTPPSACPACGARIRPWDNVPLLSWLLLAGRCRDCRTAIPWRYPAVELASGLLVVGLAWALGPRPELVPALAFTLALVAVALIDLDFRIIPDEISLGGLVVGLFARGFTLEGVLAGVIGALVGGGALWLVAAGYKRATGIDGLGGGDVKLAGMIGAFLGWPGVFLTIFGAAVAGSVVGLALIAFRGGDRRMALPFGTFLAPAAVFVALAGPSLWRWYGGLFGSH